MVFKNSRAASNGSETTENKSSGADPTGNVTMASPRKCQLFTATRTHTGAREFRSTRCLLWSCDSLDRLNRCKIQWSAITKGPHRGTCSFTFSNWQHPRQHEEQ